MDHSSLITVTAAAPSADHSAIWAVVIAQAVTLLLFAINAWLTRQNERDKRARDTKRDVLLEVAPAVHRVYMSLAELTNPNTRVDDWHARLAAAHSAVAKLTAVAGNETLLAARKLMTAMGIIMVRMMGKRVEVGTDLEASKQLIAFWKSEIAVLPDLIADFSNKARAEIPLPLDKEAFSEGLKASNEAMFEELERLIQALSKQQAGDNREAQSGQTDAQVNESAGSQPIVPPPGVHLTPEQVQSLSNDLMQLRQQATFWEYRFLNQFLVHRTQTVLNWLIERQSAEQPTSVGYYDAELAARVVSPGEREAVLKALEAHRLVTVNHGMLLVTEKGLDYARWRGPVPLPPAVR